METIGKIFAFIRQLFRIRKSKAVSQSKTRSFQMPYESSVKKDSKDDNAKGKKVFSIVGEHTFKLRYLNRTSQAKAEEVDKITELSKREVRRFGTFSPVKHFIGTGKKRRSRKAA